MREVFEGIESIRKNARRSKNLSIKALITEGRTQSAALGCCRSTIAWIEESTRARDSQALNLLPVAIG
jgi:hypothetical protein